MLGASRFDYIRFDSQAQSLMVDIRKSAEKIEAEIERLPNGRAKALAMTKLEECYMWCGKAVRDDQIARTGTCEDVPERGD